APLSTRLPVGTQAAQRERRSTGTSRGVDRAGGSAPPPGTAHAASVKAAGEALSWARRQRLRAALQRIAAEVFPRDSRQRSVHQGSGFTCVRACSLIANVRCRPLPLTRPLVCVALVLTLGG